MPGTDFSKYHTYKWVAIEGGAHPNQIMDQEIRQDIDAQLASKGMTKTDSDKADLYIGYQVAVDQQKQWNAWGTGRGFGGGMGSATSSTISNGTLVLDMYDPGTKQLVWTGRATKTLDPSSNQEKNMKNLNKSDDQAAEELPAETEVSTARNETMDNKLGRSALEMIFLSQSRKRYTGETFAT